MVGCDSKSTKAKNKNFKYVKSNLVNGWRQVVHKRRLKKVCVCGYLRNLVGHSPQIQCSGCTGRNSSWTILTRFLTLFYELAGCLCKSRSVPHLFESPFPFLEWGGNHLQLSLNSFSSLRLFKVDWKVKCVCSTPEGPWKAPEIN